MVLDVYPPPPGENISPRKIPSSQKIPLVENKAFQIWEFYLSFFFRREKEFWCLCNIRHTLKFTLRTTREQTGLFAGFFQLRARQDKDRWQNRWEIYNLGCIFAHKGEGVEYLDSWKSENHSYLIICRITVPDTFWMQDRYTLSPPP